MSVGEGAGKVIGVAAVAAAGLALLWIFRDKIAGFFGEAVIKPVQEAVGGAADWVNETVIQPTAGLVGGAANVAATGAGTLWDMLTAPVKWAADLIEPVFGVSQSTSATIPDLLQPPTPMPTEADILWAAKMAEVQPVRTEPPPGAWEVRGYSLTGAPLYRPANQLVGYYTDIGSGTVMEIWQMGGDNPQLYLKGESGGLFGYWASVRQAEQYGWPYTVEWL